MSTRSAVAKRLPPCQYGTGCYRKNPTHFNEFSHPQSVFDTLGPTHPATANAKQSVADYLFGTGAPAPAAASKPAAKKRRGGDGSDDDDDDDEEKEDDEEDEDEDMDGSSKKKKKADKNKRAKGKKAAEDDDDEEEVDEDEEDEAYLKSNGLDVKPDAAVADDEVAVLALKKRYARVVELTGLRVLIRYKKKYYIVCNRDFGEEYGPDERPNGNWCVRPLPHHIDDDDGAVRHSLLPRFAYAEHKCPKQWLNPIKKFIKGKGLKPKSGEWIDHMEGALPSQRERLPNLYDLQGYADSDIDTSACLNLSNCSGDTAFEMKYAMTEEWQKALEEEAKTDSKIDLTNFKKMLDDEGNEGPHKLYERVYEDAIQSAKAAAVQTRLSLFAREIEVPLIELLETESNLPRVLAKIVASYALPRGGPTVDEMRATRIKIWRDRILPTLE